MSRETFIVRVDRDYFEEASPTSLELALDRMNHWFAANVSEFYIRMSLCDTFDERGCFQVVHADDAPVRIEITKSIEDAIWAALDYTIATWPVAS